MAKVLIVDDEESIRHTFGAFLKQDLHDVSTADNAINALELIKSDQFDVVISDIILPRMNGIELLSEIRKISRNIQVIMITGEPTVETASEAVRAGAFDYLAKPVSGRDIRKVVVGAARIKQLSNEKQRLEEENFRYQKHLERLVDERTAMLIEANKRLELEIHERTGVQEELQRSLDELAKANEDIIHIMSETIEKRDPYTAGHQLRVAKLARRIAEKMGMAEERIRLLYMAGLIHDLGKMTVPAEILARPGDLSNEELALVRKHPQVGYEILHKTNLPKPIAEIVLQHHERLDGSGYPQGLSDSRILLETKIISVSDVVEAMAYHRPYRPGQGLASALEDISAKKGVQYDAVVVDACLQLFYEDGFDFD